MPLTNAPLWPKPASQLHVFCLYSPPKGACEFLELSKSSQAQPDSPLRFILWRHRPRLSLCNTGTPSQRLSRTNPTGKHLIGSSSPTPRASVMIVQLAPVIGRLVLPPLMTNAAVHQANSDQALPSLVAATHALGSSLTRSDSS